MIRDDNQGITRTLTMCFRITKRDACIVATVIQWLGSNVGFDFLRTCLEKCGYRLDRIDNQQFNEGNKVAC